MPEENEDLRNLRAKADSADAANQAAALAQREVAFLKAGIDTDAGPGKLLFQAYAGEPTKDAVLAAAGEYGITPAAAAAPTATPDEAAAAQAAAAQAAQDAAAAAAQDALAGGQNPPPPNPDGQAPTWEQAGEDFRKRLGTQEEDRASTLLVDTAVAQAKAGNGWKGQWTPEQLETGIIVPGSVGR